jgi:hypothetical protein
LLPKDNTAFSAFGDAGMRGRGGSVRSGRAGGRNQPKRAPAYRYEATRIWRRRAIPEQCSLCNIFRDAR